VPGWGCGARTRDLLHVRQALLPSELIPNVTYIALVILLLRGTLRICQSTIKPCTAREVRTHLINHMRVDPFPLSRGIFWAPRGTRTPVDRLCRPAPKPLDHRCIFILSLWQGSNLRPNDYKSFALPAELQRRLFCWNSKTRTCDLSRIRRLLWPTELYSSLSYSKRDLNSHAFRHWVLNPGRLPFRHCCISRSPCWTRTSIFGLEDRRPVRWTKEPFFCR